MHLSVRSASTRSCLAAFLAVVMASACTSEFLKPTYEAKFRLSAEQQGEFKSLLDSALQPHGLNRFGAAPGLDELKKRKIFYVEYRPNIKSKWTYLSATDLLNQDTIEIRVYPEGLPSAQSPAAALASVKAVLTRYGASLQSRQGN